MKSGPGRFRPRIAVIGAGAVGTTVARALRRAKLPVLAVCRRDRGRARRAAMIVGGGCRAFTDPGRAAQGADLVLLAMGDGEIEAAGRSLADQAVLAPGVLVVHLSGAVPSGVLAPLAERGARVASLHPLQTFAAAPRTPRARGARLEGVWWFHEGDARADCARLVGRIGGRLRSLDPAGKALYHAAAVAASNYLVVVEDLAARIAREAGLAPEDALAALLPLVEETVRNLGRVGLPAALTGPVARGDAGTVRLHRAALKAADPQLDKLYAALGRHALRVARERGLAPDRARRTDRALRP